MANSDKYIQLRYLESYIEGIANLYGEAAFEAFLKQIGHENGTQGVYFDFWFFAAHKGGLQLGDKSYKTCFQSWTIFMSFLRILTLENIDSAPVALFGRIGPLFVLLLQQSALHQRCQQPAAETGAAPIACSLHHLEHSLIILTERQQ